MQLSGESWVLDADKLPGHGEGWSDKHLNSSREAGGSVVGTEISIDEEDKRKPLTDDKLAKLLLEKGYPIARRTVAKYREQLDIPVARMRKEI